MPAKTLSRTPPPMSGALVAAPNDAVPLALHPATLERHHGADPITRAQVRDDVVAALANAVGSAQAASQKLLDAKKTLAVDPTLTPAARALRVRELALAVGDRHAPALDRARAQTVATISKLETESLPAAPRDAIAAEIRNAIRAMPPKARGRAIEAALASQDAATIGAILAAPSPLLTGVDPAVIETLKPRWRKAAHPEAAERLERLGKALEDLDRAGMALLTFTTRLSQNSEATAAEAAREATQLATMAVSGEGSAP